MRVISLYFILIFISNVLVLQAQNITVNINDYKHQFEGAGVSIGLFMGHHYSMNAENQDKAIQLINKDLNMKYLQDYIGIYPSDDPAYFDRRANYIKAAKSYRPDIQVSMVGNIFPDDLRHDIVVNNKTYAVLNTDDPEIYDKLAQWYFELFKGFHDRGVTVDILNVVNEPDLANCNNQCRKYHYGYDGDTQKGVSIIFTEAVTKFKAMLNDPQINTANMKVPLIMGPSTISPNGCLSYIKYFKKNYPEAWNQIDIVATHQYINGSRDDLFEEILAEIEGKTFHQSETHASRFANQADNLGNLPIDEDHRTALSLANLFGTAVNNGVSAWYYFENNYPDTFHPGGLIQVAWQSTNPVPYKHYYAYRQLTSAQPAFSHVVGHDVTGISNAETTTFRKADEDTVYVHFSNFLSVNKNITVTLEDIGGAQTINSLSIRRTSSANDDDIVLDENYTDGRTQLTFTAAGYSVNTLKIGFNKAVTSVEDFNRKEAISLFYDDQGVSLISQGNDPIIALRAYDITGQLLFEKENFNSQEVWVPYNAVGPGLTIWQIFSKKGMNIKKSMAPY
ncbi:hypothetical protein FNH22_08125 [Fulvivirga sp. M361]|uniref:hypothetical protein n=1 Tax=Fulvivirga sp. M361 TaxID=2594266 RepID=UPI00117A48CC|nr:hypothetical protein [Fulvivirga sp. M361]TRX60010.1 hypothetical protein FNH22_08125 [Fulvivirga sp. M361]